MRDKFMLRCGNCGRHNYVRTKNKRTHKRHMRVAPVLRHKLARLRKNTTHTSTSTLLSQTVNKRAQMIRNSRRKTKSTTTRHYWKDFELRKASSQEIFQNQK